MGEIPWGFDSLYIDQFMKKVYVLRITSESGDDYGCWVFTKKPNKSTIKEICLNTGEEIDYLHTDILESDFIDNQDT